MIENLISNPCFLQKIAAGTLKSDEVNFRILRRRLDDVQGGVFFANDDDLTNRLVFN